MNKKKRILIFIDWFLPGDKAGGPVRSVANLIAHLGNEFEFSVITRDTDYTETKPYTEIKSDQWNNSVPDARVYYISEKNLNRETITKLLSESEYDHVYLNGIWSQPFTRWPLEYLKGKRIPITVAVRGMLAPSAMAIKKTKKKAFLLFAKLGGLFSGVTFHTTTDKEAGEVRAVFGSDATVHVAGNLPRKSHAQVSINLCPDRKQGHVKLVSIARIAPEKNTLYAIEALQHVKSEVEFDIWGAFYDAEYHASCEAAVKNLPSNITVRFHGGIASEEIQKTLVGFDLMFLPTRGENFGHIILESMQAATPVLISDQTPWKNLAQHKAGWDLPLSGPEASASIIDRVAAMNNEELMEWKRGALEFARKYVEDEKLIAVNRNLFD